MAADLKNLSPGELSDLQDKLYIDHPTQNRHIGKVKREILNLRSQVNSINEKIDDMYNTISYTIIPALKEHQQDIAVCCPESEYHYMLGGKKKTRKSKKKSKSKRSKKKSKKRSK